MKSLLTALISVLFVSCSTGDANSNLPTLPDDNNRTGTEDTINKVWRFAVISDLNGSYGSTSYSQNVKSAVDYLTKNHTDFDFAISTGDMVAGQKSNLNYKAMWESFHSHVTRPLKVSNIPLYPSPGNHDAYITRKTERNHYKQSWEGEDILSLPSEIELIADVEQNYPFSYAFKMGPALFIALDNTDPQPFSTNTVRWIETVLEKNKDIKNKFIFGHIPMLPFAFKKEREYIVRNDKAFLDKMENLFEKYNVSAFLSGHSHVYYPGKRLGKTQYISVPLLGGGPRYLITKSQDESRSPYGFLVIEYSSDNGVKIKSLNASDFSEITDDSLPAFLDMPSTNGSKCSSCKNFPKSLFLDQTDRILYLRRDQ